jgi:hypothetical protein
MTTDPINIDALEHIHTWRERLSDQTIVSASEVQRRLFDLYGDLEPLPQLDMLKPWLSLTIQRELFSAAELQEFLDELTAELGTDAELTTDAGLATDELDPTPVD